MAEVVVQSKVFKQRSASILKKARELSILCDIRVCALIVDPNGKEICTYPENHADAIHLLKQFTTNTMTTKKKEKKLDFPDSFDDKLIDGLSTESVIEISKMLNLKIEEARNRVQFLKKEQEKQQEEQDPIGFQINPSPNSDYEMMLDFPPIPQEELGGGGGDLGNDWKFSNFEPEVVIDLPPPLSYYDGCCSTSGIMAPPPQSNYFGSESGSTYTESCSPFEEVLSLLQHSPLEADMLDMFDCGSPMATYPLQPMPPLDYCFN